jgi:uncharacterized protein (TIGR03083 family)
VRFAHTWHAPRGVTGTRETDPVWRRTGALRCTHPEHANRSTTSGTHHYDPNMTDWAQLYKDNVAAVTALAADLDDDELATTVPGSPAWTVRDVIAHMAGCPDDVINGRMDGAPSPEWTARAVDERAGLPVAELVSEMRGNTDSLLEAVAESSSPAPVWDIAVHHADLHEALGKKELSPALWQPVLDAIAPRMLGERRDGAGGAGLRAVPDAVLAALAQPDRELGRRLAGPRRDLCLRRPRRRPAGAERGLGARG